jgi:acetoacetate decarboxylase
MGFVRTPEEIAEIEGVLSRPRYTSAQRLSVEFLTSTAAAARLLPPPLELADSPLATVTVGRWRSNCAGDFVGATVHLAARHEGVSGGYALAMYMSAEAPVTFGREVVGEPKKLGSAALFSSGRHHSAYLDRGGRRLIGLTMEERQPVARPHPRESVTFNVKARTAAGGVGLQEDAILTRTTFVNSFRELCAGPAEVALAGTVHDPLDELEVVSVVRGVYAEYDAEASCEEVGTIPAADFLPYHYGRADDPTALS